MTNVKLEKFKRNLKHYVPEFIVGASAAAGMLAYLFYIRPALGGKTPIGTTVLIYAEELKRLRNGEVLNILNPNTLETLKIMLVPAPTE